MSFLNTKDEIDSGFAEYTVSFISKRMSGSIHANRFQFALASCIYFSLCDLNEEPEDESNISLVEVRNGLNLFNVLTSKNINITF